MKQDNQLIVFMHLSQLLDTITGVGGFIVPLIIWLRNKDRIYKMDEHGKAIINFQLSLFVMAFLSIPLILFFGLGVLMLLSIAALNVIFPVVNAIRAGQDEPPYYPLSFRFIH
ncbi:MAG: DUF4870 domain-containing protein [Flavobacteriaceae bacterium]